MGLRYKVWIATRCAGCRSVRTPADFCSSLRIAFCCARLDIWSGPAEEAFGCCLPSSCTVSFSILPFAHSTKASTERPSQAAGPTMRSLRSAARCCFYRGYFRLFHFAHHRFTQDPARDPELAQPAVCSVAPYLWRASGLPNWYKRLNVTLTHALTGQVAEPFVPAAKHRLIVREARGVWACYLAILVLSLIFRRADALIYWVLPMMAGQPFLRLFLASEHTDCALSDNMYANTRTTYTNGAVRLLAWQMPYHVEHHAFPAVPFHALAQVNSLIRGRIAVSAPGYIALHRELLRKLRRAQ